MAMANQILAFPPLAPKYHPISCLPKGYVSPQTMQKRKLMSFAKPQRTIPLAKSDDRPDYHQFEASTWIQQFLQTDSIDESGSKYEEATVKKTHSQHIEEVRSMLMSADTNAPLEHRLGLLDSIQRLGISYHFESEIGNILRHVYEQGEYLTREDLYTAALSFRLLRNGGFNASAGIFDKFTDEKAEFSESVTSDIQGMLALYEASYMSIPGEEILEKARTFTTMHLKVLFPKLKETCPPWLVSQVSHALYRPLQLNSSRFEARQYIPIYKDKGFPYGEALLRLAAPDYNILQSMHRQELKLLFQWWKGLKLEEKLPMVRHRVTEIYVWMTMIYFEAKYAIARNWSTKMLTLLTIIDDIYDTYGTADELVILTDAINRWDMASITGLPEYMQTIMLTFKSVFEDIEENTRGRPHILYRVKQQFAKLARAYHQERKWMRNKHVPTLEEYQNTQLITGGLFILPTIYYAGMGDAATEEVFAWTCDSPVSEFIQASGVIARMQDDSSLHANETDSTTLGFRTYMKELRVSEVAAKAMVREKIKDAFREKNKGVLKGATSTAGIPKDVVDCMMNNARASDIFNRDEDWYGVTQQMRDAASSLLLDPVVIDD